MGYPSVGCESIYRNSLADTTQFFRTYHKDVKVKKYNIIIRFIIYVLKKIEYMKKIDFLILM
jgi:hypothetical protein